MTMPCLEGAHDLAFYNSSFVEITNPSHGTDSIGLLVKHVVPGALHDSAERYDPPKCHPETRTAVLDAIRSWAEDANLRARPLMWLNGPAGAGKSAIAQTLAEEWHAAGLLAAAFFFSRTKPGCNENEFVVPTLTYQIASSFPGARAHIEEAITKDPMVFSKSLRSQMSSLVVEPLRHILSSGTFTASPPKLVVIDGLDECALDREGKDHEEQQREILEAIVWIFENYQDLPIRFLIASRPERQIRESFGRTALEEVSLATVLDEKYNPNADITLYLRCRINEIKRQNASIDPSWPPEGTIDRLVEKSSGIFVYASTAVRYISAPRSDPRERLDIILGIKTHEDSTESPFRELDALYAHILGSIASDSQHIVIDILGILCYDFAAWNLNFASLFPSLKYLSPLYFEKLFFIPQGQIYMHLIDLHSILNIPPVESAGTAPIRLTHASFTEFLTHPSRSHDLHISKTEISLSRQVAVFKHLLIYTTARGPERKQYDNHALYRVFFTGLSSGTPHQCPPSGQLKEGIEAAMSSDDGRYATMLNSFQLDGLWIDDSKQRQMRLRLIYEGFDAEEYVLLLDYLQRCNKAQSQPYSWQRGLTALRLHSQSTVIAMKERWRTIGVATPREPEVREGSPESDDASYDQLDDF